MTNTASLPFDTFGVLNNWPLRSAAGGLFTLLLWAETTFKYTDHPEFATGWPLPSAMLIIVAAVCLGVLWWPPFLAPRWYRDWQAAGRRGRALPYSNEELRAADALPPGPKKQRLMADIGKSQHALWALKQADSARPKNV